LLADVAALIATGKNNAVLAQTDSEAEERKRILSILAEGDAVICVDNIEKPFGSSVLCSVLTSLEFKDRLLGFNRTLTVPTNATFLATGNNLTFVGDLSTRVVLCSLDAGEEKPEERSFDIDLRKYIPENRSKLVLAGLTMLRAYHVAGRPKQAIKQFGRFEEWSDWVRSTIVWLDLEDPCKTRQKIENTDPVRKQLATLFHVWHDYFLDLSFSLNRAIKKASDEKDEKEKPKAEALLETLLEISEGKKEINTRVLGNFLSKYAGRIESGFQLEKGDKYQHADTWRVTKTK
jgi:hypothetical protein